MAGAGDNASLQEGCVFCELSQILASSRIPNNVTVVAESVEVFELKAKFNGENSSGRGQ